MSDHQNQAGDAAAASTPEAPPLRSSHTSNFPGLLEQLGASLLITTYQAQKVLMVRNDQGKLNTHFRDFEAPMGLALAGELGRRGMVGGQEDMIEDTTLTMLKERQKQSPQPN